MDKIEELKKLFCQHAVIQSVCDLCDSTTDKPTYKLCDMHYAEYEKWKKIVLYREYLPSTTI